MPKAYRECSFCSKTSIGCPESLFFTVTDHIKSALSLAQSFVGFICEDHFADQDLQPHGKSKRLVKNAVPIKFPSQRDILFDHGYIKVTKLDLVSWVG